MIKYLEHCRPNSLPRAIKVTQKVKSFIAINDAKFLHV